MMTRLVLLGSALVFGLATCGDGESRENGNATTAATTAPPATTAAASVDSDIPEFTEKKAADHPLLNPDKLTETAPGTYTVKFETSKGDFMIEVHRDWSPNGADRFYNLVKSGYFDGAVFFRVIHTFMVQFGINGDPAVNAKWQTATIADDPVKESNKPGYVSFATSGPNSRTTQVFINYIDNARLDTMGFSPFGKVIEGMDVVREINGKYGEGFPQGRGPSQGRIQAAGNKYLRENYPDMDYVKSATIVE